MAVISLFIRSHGRRVGPKVLNGNMSRGGAGKPEMARDGKLSSLSTILSLLTTRTGFHFLLVQLPLGLLAKASRPHFTTQPLLKSLFRASSL